MWMRWHIFVKFFRSKIHNSSQKYTIRCETFTWTTMITVAISLHQSSFQIQTQSSNYIIAIPFPLYSWKLHKTMQLLYVNNLEYLNFRILSVHDGDKRIFISFFLRHLQQRSFPYCVKYKLYANRTLYITNCDIYKTQFSLNGGACNWYGEIIFAVHSKVFFCLDKWMKWKERSKKKIWFPNHERKIHSLHILKSCLYRSIPQLSLWKY